MAIYSEYLEDGKFSYLNAAKIHWFTTLLIILTIIGFIMNQKIGSITLLVGFYCVYLVVMKWPANAKYNDYLYKTQNESK